MTHSLLLAFFYAMSFPDSWQNNSVKDVVVGAVNSGLVRITCCL